MNVRSGGPLLLFILFFVHVAKADCSILWSFSTTPNYSSNIERVSESTNLGRRHPRYIVEI